MSGWEYKVVPAPSKGLKARGVKGPEERFANAIETLMNEMGADGWEFQRSETLPSIERAGLTGTTTEWRNVMVFRRKVSAPMDAFEPELLPPPMPEPAPPVAEEAPTVAEDAPAEVAATEPAPQDDPDADHIAATAPEEDVFEPGVGATQMLTDNGVEETSEVAGMTASLKRLVAQRKVKETEG